jgi:broad specificity phosphatase PhoE
VLAVIPKFTNYETIEIVARHAQSKANVSNTIASRLEDAGGKYGLTPEGFRQAATELVSDLWNIIDANPGRDVVFVHSPLPRTKETAEEAFEGLARNKVIDREGTVFREDSRLAERDFGIYEGQPADRYYPDVWAQDEKGKSVEHLKVASLKSVSRRTQEARAYYRQKYPGAIIIYVTHGDVASVMIADQKHAPLSRHRRVGALPNAGIRVLNNG